MALIDFWSIKCNLNSVSVINPTIPFFNHLVHNEYKSDFYLKACFHIFILASYDSTGSIPTTDISMETHSSHVTQESTYPKRNQPVPHSQQPRKPVEDPFISPASHQVCCRSSLRKHMWGLPWLRICCSQHFSQMEKVGAK